MTHNYKIIDRKEFRNRLFQLNHIINVDSAPENLDDSIMLIELCHP